MDSRSRELTKGRRKGKKTIFWLWLWWIRNVGSTDPKIYGFIDEILLRLWCQMENIGRKTSGEIVLIKAGENERVLYPTKDRWLKEQKEEKKRKLK